MIVIFYRDDLGIGWRNLELEKIESINMGPCCLIESTEVALFDDGDRYKILKDRDRKLGGLGIINYALNMQEVLSAVKEGK